MNKIKLGNQIYQIKRLSAIEVHECIIRAEGIFEALKHRVYSDVENGVSEECIELARALGEHATLVYMCLYLSDEEGRAFSSPMQAMSEFSISQLCTVYDEYCRLSDTENNNCELSSGDEYCYNENFSKEACNH